MNGLMPVSNDEYTLLATGIADFLGNEADLAGVHWNIPESNENRAATAILQRTQWLLSLLAAVKNGNRNAATLANLDEAKKDFKDDLRQVYSMLKALGHEVSGENKNKACDKMHLPIRSRKRYDNSSKKAVDMTEAIELLYGEGVQMVKIRLMGTLRGGKKESGGKGNRRLPPGQRLRRIYYDFIPPEQTPPVDKIYPFRLDTNKRTTTLKVDPRYGGLKMVAYAVYVSVRNEESDYRSPLVTLILPVWPTAPSEDKDSDKSGE